MSTAMLALALVMLPTLPVQGGQVLLDFTDLPIPGGTDADFFAPILTHGFTLTSTDPTNGFSAGFQAHGPNSSFYAGAIGLAAFAPATSPPDNVIELTQTNGQPFSLLSIDLARNFAFDPAPTVTFTGMINGGGTVTETFTVTTPVGDAVFQPFQFSPGFTNLVSVTWGQPEVADGLNQFTDILLQTGPVPEPSTLALMACGLPLALAYTIRVGRRNRGGTGRRLDR